MCILRGEEKGDMARNLVTLEKLLTDVYHGREQVEEDDNGHISPAFAMLNMSMEREKESRKRPHLNIVVSIWTTDRGAINQETSSTPHPLLEGISKYNSRGFRKFPV